ncbi:MAG: VOC family protein [Chloroflexi bacterium]|nr:MAG: VOC family protein [Chloroflexota bacterium]MBL1196437.1 VOC family protein [Chloroflexota bacterium]NOH13732.1 VOC family protein [Chloroflexota bacterium]
MIERIDHAALVVSDLKRSIDFYTEVLGFEYTRNMDFGDRELVILSLGQSPAAKIELLRYDATDHANQVPEDRTILGLRHLAFHVSDVAETYDTLQEKGITMLEDPPFQNENGPPIAFGMDPDGILLEFTEIE